MWMDTRPHAKHFERATVISEYASLKVRLLWLFPVPIFVIQLLLQCPRDSV